MPGLRTPKILNLLEGSSLRPVKLDAIGPHVLINSAVSSFSQSGVITVGSGDNRALLVLVSFSSSNTTAPTSISMTWNGVAMTQLPNTYNTFNNGSTRQVATVAFGLVNPAPGNNTLAASWTGAQFVYIQALSFTGANQGGGEFTFPNGASASGSSANPSLNINSPPNGFVVGMTGVWTGITSVNKNQLFLDNSGTDATAAANFAPSVGGGGPVTFSAVAGLSQWAFSAASVAPVKAPSYWLNEDFNRYADSTVLAGQIPILGPAWATTGANLPTTSGGLCVSGGTGYVYGNVQNMPSGLGASVSWSGGADLSQKGMTIAYALNSNPLSLNDLLHFNFGPQGYIVSVRQAGGSFNTLQSGSWLSAASNDGVLHQFSVYPSGTSVIFGKDEEVYQTSDSRVPSVVGGTFFFEPNLQGDGLNTGIAKAWALR